MGRKPTEEEITRMEMTIEKLRFIAIRPAADFTRNAHRKRGRLDWAILLNLMARRQKIKFLKNLLREDLKSFRQP